MIVGQKLTENGVEVALFPGLQLIANPHKDYIACDFGGTDFYAPNKVIVKRNSSSAYHGVYFWTVDPVKTQKHGTTHLSYLLMHDNDVSNLPVGKIIEQGDPWYQRGGFGPDGPKTYGDHIHLCVAIGHTLKTKIVNGHQQLVGAVYPDQVFFTNDTKIVKTSGMFWKQYFAPVIETVAPIEIKETPIVETVGEPTPVIIEPVVEVIIEPVVVVSNDKPIEVPIVVVAQPIEETVERVGQEPIVEPIQEPLPIVELVVEETPSIAPQPLKQVIEPCETVEQPIPVVKQNSEPNVWSQIIAIIIKFILSLLKRK